MRRRSGGADARDRSGGHGGRPTPGATCQRCEAETMLATTAIGTGTEVSRTMTGARGAALTSSHAHRVRQPVSCASDAPDPSLAQQACGPLPGHDAARMAGADAPTNVQMAASAPND